MGEIRIVGPGKIRGYLYLVCKKKISHREVYLLIKTYLIPIPWSYRLCVTETHMKSVT